MTDIALPYAIKGNEAITAELVLASINAVTKEPLFTIKTTAPKFLDGELRAHRWFSQNSSSSRAIPVSRTLENGIYIPDDVRLTEHGMQGYTLLDDRARSKYRDDAYEVLKIVHDFTSRWQDTVHKQHLNRFLEPWTLQTKIITGGREAFNHFLKLRLASDADPAINALALAIEDIVRSAVAPVSMHPATSDAHLPFVTAEEKAELSKLQAADVSAARCARVSYNNHDGTTPNVQKDLKLAKMLLQNEHMSPFEHVAFPVMITNCNGTLPPSWEQYRKVL